MASEPLTLEQRVESLRGIGIEGVLGYACGMEDAVQELKSQAASRESDARRMQERVRELEVLARTVRHVLDGHACGGGVSVDTCKYLVEWIDEAMRATPTPPPAPADHIWEPSHGTLACSRCGFRPVVGGPLPRCPGPATDAPATQCRATSIYMDRQVRCYLADGHEQDHISNVGSGVQLLWPKKDHTAQVLAIACRNSERYHEAMVELAKGPDPAEAAIVAAIEADGEAYDMAMAQLASRADGRSIKLLGLAKFDAQADSADPNHVCTPYGCCCSGCGREVRTDG